MHDIMDSAQQNGEKSIRILTLAYQLLQAFNQLACSLGINPLLFDMHASLW